MLKKIITIFFLFITTFTAWSLSGSENIGDEVVIIIRNVNYTIDGITREDVIKHYLEIIPGEVFKSKEDVISFLEAKQQIIDNQRTISEGKISITYESDPDNPDFIFADFDIFVRDTWNVLILPYAKYDSNEGFLLSLRGRDYNFLGSLETFAWNFDYTKPDNSESEYSLNSKLAIPFYSWGYHWMFHFSEDLVFIPDEPFSADVNSGISVDIPFGNKTWQASINQYYYLNQDGSTDEDGYYFRTSAEIGGAVPSRIYLPLLGEIVYSPGIFTSYPYKPFDTLSEDRRGYVLGAKHEIYAGQINWFGNFRDGAMLSADQNLRYNFTRELWLSDFEFSFEYHKAFGWGGFSSRVKAFYKYNAAAASLEDLGEPVRGILNSRIAGDTGFFVNVDFPVKIWIWFLDRWFEGHLSPFLDYALVKPVNGNFSVNDAWYGAGIEGFAFLKAARSIYLRVSLGVDLEEVLKGTSLGDPALRDGAQIYTLFIGLGHHY